MAALSTNEEFVSRFAVTKHSWKGKYTRIFCINGVRCATINPTSIFLSTNVWDYNSTFVDLTPVQKSPVEILLTRRKGGKQEQQVFHCHSAVERADLLTDIHQFREKFDVQYKVNQARYTYKARKYRSNEEYENRVLVVTSTGISQRSVDGDEIGRYLFMHIRFMTILGDNPNALVISYGRHGKLHMYLVDNPKDIISAAQRLLDTVHWTAAVP